MSMLARYKKQGGMLELVKLIESSAEPKRSSLLNMVRNEDASFAAEVEARIFSFEKIKALDEGSIAEIVAATPPKFLALALHGQSEDFIKLCERCLGKNFADFKSEKESLEGTTVTPAQIETAHRKMISEARKLEGAGRLKLVASPVGAPVAGVPVATTAKTPPAPGAAATTGVAVPAATSAAAVSQNSSGPYPALTTFGIESPPPGLTGERLQTHLKATLGF